MTPIQNPPESGVPGGVATLDSGGKIPASQLPLIALIKPNVVASQVAQLALTAEQGDVAIRTDQNKSYMHNGGTSGTMADWTEILADSVLSVNGHTGVVTLTSADVSAVAASARTASGGVAGLGADGKVLKEELFPRTETLVDAATVALDAQNNDGGRLNTVSQGITIQNPSGSPVTFQKYMLRVKSVSSQTITWGSKFRGSSDIPLPATTFGGTLISYYGFLYHATDDKWDLIALVRGF